MHPHVKPAKLTIVFVHALYNYCAVWIIWVVPALTLFLVISSLMVVVVWLLFRRSKMKSARIRRNGLYKKY